MKKVINYFLMLITAICCISFIGCDDRYSKLTMSVAFSYSNGENVETLENGDTRISSESGTFDIRKDGSYVFYISREKKSSAKLNVKYNNAPKNFKYNVSFNPTNAIVSVSNDIKYIDDGMQYTLTANTFGSTILNINSYEGNKSTSIKIDVLEIAPSIEFKNKKMAIANKMESFVSLKDQIDYGVNSETSIKYEFGRFEDKDFKPYNDQELLASGLTFNKKTEILSLLSHTDLQNITVKAIYDNPLGDNRIAYNNIKIVSDINVFEIYKGNIKEDVKEANKISLENIYEFVVNMSDLNYMDIILKVNSNGEDVVFGMLNDRLSPFVNLQPSPSYAENLLKYICEDGTETTQYNEAKYTYGFYRIVASQNRTTNTGEYENGIYKLTFTCGYKNYYVNGYPISTQMPTKCYNLIKNFSINSQNIPSFAYKPEDIKSEYVSDAYKANIYLNTETDLKGIALKIGVAEPASIAKENSYFGIRFFNSDLTELANPTTKLKIESSIQGSLTDDQEILLGSYEKDTIFYFKPQDAEAKVNDVFYMIIYAKEPANNEAGQSACFVKFTVVQGITRIENFQLSNSKEKITFDYTNTNSSNVAIANKNISLVNNAKENVVLTLNYLPKDAFVEGIKVASGNDSLLAIEKEAGAYNKFILKPLNSGNTFIEITAINISTKYRIDVNINELITDFYVKLDQTKFIEGVGDIVINNDDKVSASEVTVVTRQSFSFSLEMLPSANAKYTAEYVLYRNDDLEKAIGKYSTDDLTSSNIIEDYGFFRFNCLTNEFIFTNDEASSFYYVLHILVKNLEGNPIEKQIKISSYVPVDNLRIQTSTYQIYDPKTIYYKDKIKNLDDLILSTNYVNDPTIFGVNALLNMDKRKSTRNFNDFGNILLYINNVLEAQYQVKNGVLQVIKQGNIISLMRNTQEKGYYWFALTNNYNKRMGNISVVISVNDIGQTPHDDATIKVLQAKTTEQLETNTNSIEFREGFIYNADIVVNVINEKSYNKDIVNRIITELEFNGSTFYVPGASLFDVNTEYMGLSNFKVNITMPTFAVYKSAIIIIPEDKLISEQNYNDFYNFEYVKVNLNNADLFDKYFLFTKEGLDYIKATEYIEGKDYYIQSIDVDKMQSVWQVASVTKELIIELSANDGSEGHPFYVSSIEELKAIGNTEASCVKNYILTRNIICDNNEDWQTIGNFYKVNNLGPNIKPGIYYVKTEDGKFEIVNDSVVNESTQYYAFGFNGLLSGLYKSILGQTTSQFGIYNISAMKVINRNENQKELNTGIFGTLGPDGKISNLLVNYGFYQPKVSTSLVFGGLVGINWGTIHNVNIDFDNFKLIAPNSLTIGGVAGVNYGFITRDNQNSTEGLTGGINISILPNKPGEDGKNRIINIGGLVGVNNNTITSTDEKVNNEEAIFGDLGFDSSLNILVENPSGFMGTAIGGACGVNNGSIVGLAIQGRVIAKNSNNVGGIAGSVIYNKDFNVIPDSSQTKSLSTKAEQEETFAIANSYSTANVVGSQNVGGVIGSAMGDSYTVVLNLLNISAENYAGDFTRERTLVRGVEYVGGLIGYAQYIKLRYSYVVSYYDCSVFNKDNDQTFDIIGNYYAGGLVGYLKHSRIDKCATYVNVKSQNTGSIFISNCIVSNFGDIKNVFAIGGISAANYSNQEFNYESSYAKVFYAKRIDYYLNGSSSTEEDIKNWVLPEGWGIDEKINMGMPFLYSQNSTTTPLLNIITSLSLSVFINDNNQPYVNYIKNNESSLILFYGEDAKNRYSFEDIKQINQIRFFDVFKLMGLDENHNNRASRFNIYSTDVNVIEVSKTGLITTTGVGVAKLIVASKLNATYKQEIEVSVIHGLTDVQLFDNATLTNRLDNIEIELLESRKYDFYLNTEYNRTLPNKPVEYSLQSSQDVGFRFEITQEIHDQYLQKANDNPNGHIYNINDLIQIGNNYWTYDANSLVYYVNTYSLKDVINAKKSIDMGLEMIYRPIITPFISTTKPLILTQFPEKKFTINIKNGVKDIVFENNIDPNIEMNQLQSFVLTVTILTDYEEDDITCSYIPTDDRELDYLVSDATKARDLNTGKLLSLSRTYTFFYKDKMKQIEKPDFYEISFGALSNSAEVNRKKITISVIGTDAIGDIFMTLYAEKNHFPSKKSEANVIYTNKDALLSLEVYPYFANYSKIRISTICNALYDPMVYQLKYNIDGTDDLFTIYEDSGLMYDDNNNLIIDKSTGQDTYLINSGGVYSYSKSYFIGISIATSVPNETEFIIRCEVLDKQNKVIAVHDLKFIALAKIPFSFSFDEKLKGSDNKYYLPINTKNLLSINTIDNNKKIEWEITSPNYELKTEERKLFIPQLIDDKFYVQVAKPDANGFMETAMIGKTIRITGKLDSEKVSEPFTLEFVITLFTVTNIHTQNVVNGEMKLDNNKTIPLKTQVDIYYDYGITNSGNKSNWYSKWYDGLATNKEDTLLPNLQACGYVLEKNFINYARQLEKMISIVDYDSESLKKISGLWWYVDKNNFNQKLVDGEVYNDGVFGTEAYDKHIAIHGYVSEINSVLNFTGRMAYEYENKQTNKVIGGIPNTKNYTYLSESYNYVFSYSESFKIKFQDSINLVNYIPVSTPEEFKNMKKGFDYRLVNDIELKNYIPFDANFNSFDGNNYKIYITSFGYSSTTSTPCNLGLFTKIEEKTCVYNTTVYYTNKVILSDSGILIPRENTLECNLNLSPAINFGGLAIDNYGTVTNCRIIGAIKIVLSVNTMEGETSPIGESFNGGFVTNNKSTGYITNSSVEKFNITCYGSVGGFVANNEGMIISSFFNNSSINNLSSMDIGGFVYSNNGIIRESYAQGIRSKKDRDIRNTEGGIASYGGDIGGFVYSNQSIIDDCYSNLWISSSNSMAGFVYKDSASSKISRCYSISYKNPKDNNTTAFPFAGPLSSSFNPKVVVSGELNSCYYLITNKSDWQNTDFYENENSDPSKTPANKKAIGLNFDKFATHSSFVNYNLSLMYKTGNYREKGSYNYIDGYTWVIIEGKPVIVSTLTKTISQQDYEGKKKIYKKDIKYFELNKNTEVKTVQDSKDKTKTDFYIDRGGNTVYIEDLLYTIYTKTEKVNEKIERIIEEYVFPKKGDLDSLRLVITYEKEGEKPAIIKTKTAEYGKGLDRKVLDVINMGEGGQIATDSNYRANDTIEIDIVDRKVKTINYKPLANAMYFYNCDIKKISEPTGSRTNPELIYNYESFIAHFSKSNTQEKFYRVIRDIDLNYNYSPTSRTTFSGIIQGNHMSINNIALSYYNNVVDDKERLNANSFGLFSAITSENNEKNDTVISNLNLNIDKILSNAHTYVGGLAGKVYSGDVSNGRKIFINNVAVKSNGSKYAYVQGKNAVGGLIGFAKGNIILKDIYSEIGANSTDNIFSAQYLPSRMLYIPNGDNSQLSYSAGVVGIFDGFKVKDDATQKEYNASNIVVHASNKYIGNIVGSAFGLVGDDTIVNYANVFVKDSADAFVKSSSYSGGLAGENRGVIVSSSVSYIGDEQNGITDIGVTKYSNNYFYDKIAAKTFAIGGLVGLNNGGFISNSKTSINVRNDSSLIAGGAVGRMIDGGMKNVISSGSVKSGRIVGGLIGSINDRDIMEKEGFYSKDALLPFNKDKIIGFTLSEANLPSVVISQCVAETNWLSSDYSYLKNLNTTNRMENVGAVAGFIGLISFYSQTGTGFNESIDAKILYKDNSYYSNVIYPDSSSNKPYYLRAVYLSANLDLPKNKNIVPKILEETESGIKTQKVFAFETREMFYNSPDIPVLYSVITRKNDNYKNMPNNIYMSKIYTIINPSSNEILNCDDFYKPIQVGPEWTSIGTSYEWFFERFGQIYYKEKEEYILVTDKEHFELIKEGKTFYFIANTRINNFKYSKTYNVNRNDIVLYENGNLDKRISDIRFSDIEHLKSQTNIYVNGLNIPVDLTKSSVNQSADGSYIILLDNIDLLLNDGGIITKIIISAQDMLNGDTPVIDVTNVTIYFNYNNVQKCDVMDMNPVGCVEEINNITLNYKLFLSPKKLIFKDFNNGYWNFDKNFMSQDKDLATIYPENKELADIYVWDEFKSGHDNEGRVTNITTAEDLAALAYSVNHGISYEGQVVKLNANIDLSGKYWIPIGIGDYYFNGTFDGCGNSIKYISVSKNSFIKYSNLYDSAVFENLSNKVGLFGNIKNAIIKDLKIVSGEVKGKIAGGVAATAINSKLSNITCNNNVLGVNIAGGIVGTSKNTEIYACQSYANIQLLAQPTIDEFIYVGGIAGKMEGGILGRDLSLSNSKSTTNTGVINIVNKNTRYLQDNPYYLSLYAGGIVGKIKDTLITDKIVNNGNMNIVTNAHKLYIGGIGGYLDNIASLEGLFELSNSGDILITYTNTCTSDFANTMEVEFEDANNLPRCSVGGLFGSLNSNLKLSNNSGDVHCKVENGTGGNISLSGLVGRLASDNKREIIIERNYNIGSIDTTTKAKSTKVYLGSILGLIDLSERADVPAKQLIKVSDSYNMGDLSSTKVGMIYVGGIVGSCMNGVVDKKQELIIEHCMNVGSTEIFNIEKQYNALGAIIATDNNLLTIKPEDSAPQADRNYYNFYLRGVAHSEGYVAQAYTTHNDSYEPIEVSTFAQSRVSTSLKDKEFNYTKPGLKDELIYIWDFENIWTQEYDTWYPTLKGNESTSYWSQEQLALSQSVGVYEIDSAEQLSNLAAQVNSGRLDTTNKIFSLEKYVDLANRYWTPIGTPENPFKGTFDGNGYVIKNLTIDGSVNKNHEYAGLFGFTEDASIKNLAIESPHIMNVQIAGGLVASANMTSIRNVYTECGDSKTCFISGSLYAGGIVGRMDNLIPEEYIPRNKSQMNTSYNNIPVSVEIDKDVEIQNCYIGGLIGCMSDTKVSNSYNSYNATIGILDTGNADENKNSGAVVIGGGDKKSSMINVFNISKKIVVKNKTAATVNLEILPYIYQISEDSNETIIKPYLENPSLDRLVDGEYGRVEDVWIKEYSLNNEENSTYPTLRGLGKEWKNTESETLINYQVDNNVLGVLQKIKTKVEEMSSGDKPEIRPTLLNFAVENNLDYKPKNIYLITNAKELTWISNEVNNGNLSTYQNEFILLNDIDLSGAYWTPIGNIKEYPFKGIFNFNGHVIHGMTIDTSNSSYVGLFGYTKGATILNGYIDKAFIKVTNNKNDTQLYAGTIAGYAEDTNFINISVSTLLSASSNSNVYVGGAVGYVSESLPHIIRNIHVYEDINVQNSRFIDLGKYKKMVVEIYDDKGDEQGKLKSNMVHIGGFSDSGIVYAGGLIGYLIGAHDTNKTSFLIEQSINDCNVVAVSISTSSNVYVGGLVGFATEALTVNRCQNNGKLKSYSTKFDMVGGLVGFASNAEIRNSLFNGYLETRQDASRGESQNIWSYIGGFVAMMESGSLHNNVMGKDAMTIISNTNRDVCIGGVIGYATNKEVRVDGVNIYNKAPLDQAGFPEAGSSGFAKEVGFSNRTDDYTTKYKTDIADINVETYQFKKDIWELSGDQPILQSLQNYTLLCTDKNVFYRKKEGEDIPITKPIYIRDFHKAMFVVDPSLIGQYKVCLAMATKNSKNSLEYEMIISDPIASEIISIEAYTVGKNIDSSAMCFISLIPVTNA